MPRISPHQKVIVELRKIIKQVNLYSVNLAQNNGLTVSQLNILQDLENAGKTTISDLSRKNLISVQTTTEILHRLEKKGLIHREKSTEDKRMIYYSLTDLGKEVLDKSPQLLQEIFIDGFNDLEEWEQNMLIANLQRVSSMLKAQDIDASPILSPNPELVGDVKDSSILPIVERPILTKADVTVVKTIVELERQISLDELSQFMYENMKPFNDTLPMTRQGITDSLSGIPSEGGFIVLGKIEGRIAGAVVMLATGMSAYIPEHCLLFAAVDRSFRNYSIGQQLIEEVIARVPGDMYLHVEYDNRAKRLYERMGFVNKYAEMRFYPEKLKS